MNKKVTYFEARKRASFLIKQHHLDPLIADYLIIRRLNWGMTDLLVNYRNPMPLKNYQQYQADVKAYLSGEPPQYIIGSAPFFDMNLFVNKDVLIPRVETEDLVEWVLKDYDDHKLNVLDLGTGSGAIALALKKQRPKWHVVASDISESGLQVARRNARHQKQTLDLVQSDLFANIDIHNLDLIVSNPPYISKNEIDYMDKDVLDYEPHLALFADNNGLLIYQKIAEYLKQQQVKNQTLFLEIGFHQGLAVKKIFAQALPDSKIELKRDLSGNDRMIRVNY